MFIKYYIYVLNVWFWNNNNYLNDYMYKEKNIVFYMYYYWINFNFKKLYIGYEFIIEDFKYINRLLIIRISEVENDFK